MAVSDLSGDVKSFLDEHVTSVMQLEVLLMLRETGVVSTPSDVSRRVGGSVDAAIACLTALDRSGLVDRLADEAELRYRYGPSTPKLAKTVDDVADSYARRKVAVITHIYSEPDDPLRSFSDAFRLRKER
jgi:hypothetical protein